MRTLVFCIGMDNELGLNTVVDAAVIGLTNLAAVFFNEAGQIIAVGLGAAYTIVRIRYYLAKTKQVKREIKDLEK